MKNIIPFVYLLMIVACDNNKSGTEKTTVTDTTKTESSDPNKPKDLLQIKTELESMSPATDEELQALFPEKLGEATRTELEIDETMGVKGGKAKYEINDSTYIRVEIRDCAGSSGSGFLSTQYIDASEQTGADDETTFKVVQYRGNKAFESCMKNRMEDCTFTWFNGKRYLIYMDGKNTGAEKLKQTASGLFPE